MWLYEVRGGHNPGRGNGREPRGGKQTCDTWAALMRGAEQAWRRLGRRRRSRRGAGGRGRTAPWGPGTPSWGLQGTASRPWRGRHGCPGPFARATALPRLPGRLSWRLAPGSGLTPCTGVWPAEVSLPRRSPVKARRSPLSLGPSRHLPKVTKPRGSPGQGREGAFQLALGR